jgi:apolipoprotein N-acyltransferase
LCQRNAPIFRLALAYGLGLFGAGASWVYVSIAVFGMTSQWLAVTLTALFVGALALVFALPYLAFNYFKHLGGYTKLLLVLPLFFLFSEWLRGWFLTGFPWLYAGYGHLFSWLNGYAPVFGVLGIGYLLALSIGLALVFAHSSSKGRFKIASIALACTAAIWVGGYSLNSIDWTTPKGAPINVAMVQVNIPQEQKWLPSMRQPTYDRLMTMSDPLWSEADWIIWPEAALPVLYENAESFIETADSIAKATDTALTTGVLVRDLDTGKIYNSISAHGTGSGLYHKARLVPFGEYVPLEYWLRGTIDFFNLPTSIIAPFTGQPQQLKVGQIIVGANICYEVVYPNLVAQSARDANVLLTISNDGWFGDSIGPLQHLEMAQMRALETQRPLVRATNSGVSAVVDYRGSITARAPQFQLTSLSASVQPRSGATPFMRWQSTPLLAVLLIGFSVALFMARSQNRLNQRIISAH